MRTLEGLGKAQNVRACFHLRIQSDVRCRCMHSFTPITSKAYILMYNFELSQADLWFFICAGFEIYFSETSLQPQPF